MTTRSETTGRPPDDWVPNKVGGIGMRAYTYGDSGFKGNGILKCRACGEPYRDHPHIGPCPSLGEGRIGTVRRQVVAAMTDTEREAYDKERAEAEVARELLYGRRES